MINSVRVNSMALDSFQKVGLGGLAAIAIAFAGYSGSQMGKEPDGSKSGQIGVHVAGAVRNPGVVRIAEGSNVQDAIKAAGGTVKGADLAGLNLAERVVEGTKIEIAGSDSIQGFMPSMSSVVSPEPKRVVASASVERDDAPQGLISLSRASASELDKLPGVGPATAEKIIAHRQQYGPFVTVEDLMKVKGIGPKKMEKIRPLVSP